MENICTTFDIIENNAKVPIEYEKIRCHIVFGVNMDVTHKVRLFIGRHTTEFVEVSNHSNVISRESVRIVMIIAALNDLKLETGNIQNEYLTALCLKKIYIICGLEFGPDLEVKQAIIIRALYNHKRSSKVVYNHLSTCIKELEWLSCKADTSLYYRIATRSDSGTYYNYLLCISHEPSLDLDKFDRYFKINDNSRGVPKTYFGEKSMP